MSFLRRFFLYFHTLRYLKPIQIWGRATFHLIRPKPDLRSAPSVRQAVGNWYHPAERRVSMVSLTRFRFLNDECDIVTDNDWNRPELPKLWAYNLHYFDDLNAARAGERRDWHGDLIVRWVAENPPGLGTGWEPYPLSLRIVNWIKWALAGNVLDARARESLAVQTRFLARRLERHLLGNHFFANAKALVFAGCFFDGEEASEWLCCGMGILAGEIPEQILADGGHFERSTMYHALAYEDMLDLKNLEKAYSEVLLPWSHLTSAWQGVIEKMGHWLGTMCHPDGEIAFFNDAAVGIAPSPSELFAYAGRLGLSAEANAADGVTWLKASGYVRAQREGAVMIADVAPIGPDYLPGHAHADTLSFELSLDGKRIVVNSGTSCYGTGPMREWERSTAAHSTVEVDGLDSSEVWAGFRVARRAIPFDVAVKTTERELTVSAAHNGYRRGRRHLVHRRQWKLGDGYLTIEDRIDGKFGKAVSRFNFHPAIAAEKIGAAGKAIWAGGSCSWHVAHAESAVVPSRYSPEFGLLQPASRIELIPMTNRLSIEFRWTGQIRQSAS